MVAIIPSKGIAVNNSKVVSTRSSSLSYRKNLAAPFLSFLTELNGDTAAISNGGNNNPILEITLTAFTAKGSTPQSGQSVTFYTKTDDPLNGKVIFSSTSGTTDASGRCHITVKSASGLPQAFGAIYAEWHPTWDPSSTIKSRVYIELGSLPVINQTPSPLTLSLMSPSYSCIYLNDSPSYISSEVISSMFLFSIPGKISFSIFGLFPNLMYSAQSIPLGGPTGICWSLPGITGLVKLIEFNEYELNHDPFTNGRYGAPAS